MKMPLLQLQNIHKSFPGVKALTNVSFTLNGGEILALIGANGAGKSTLMNVLGGIVTRDSGEILIDGKKIQITHPLDAKKNGIAFVHQELTILPKLSILDNLLVFSFPEKLGIIQYQQAVRKAKSVLDQVGCRFDLNMRVMDIGPGDQQLVEIARVLLLEPRIVIFDEPTSSLSAREKERLFELIRHLKEKHVGIIYITHLLDEIFSIADRVAILRNGELVSEGRLKEYSREKIIRHMTGAERRALQHKKTGKQKPAILQVEGLSSRGLLKDIHFDLHQGEILGLWGLMGSGRTELVRAIVGLDPVDSGSLLIRFGDEMKPVKLQHANQWIGLISEDRRSEGLFAPMTVKVNMTIANLKAFLSRVWPLIDQKAEKLSSEDYVRKLQIKVNSLEQRMETLSGGNQQKVIISRWLQRNPIIYLMDEPIKGIDVGAKVEIKNLILDLAGKGAAVLLISSEIDELMSICDRFLVLCRGQITGEFPATVRKEELIRAATQLQAK
jgi:ABC-type sugar transport system ATPase subunit